MRKFRLRRTVTVDVEHMQNMHHEAIEQLDIMHKVLETAQLATGSLRDTLDELAGDYWQAYMEVVHMICRHDEAMDHIMKKHTIRMTQTDSEQDDQYVAARRPLLLSVLQTLLRCHRRFEYLWGLVLKGSPMSSYFNESMSIEREHTAELISIAQVII